MKLKLILIIFSCLFLFTEANASHQEPYKGKKTKVQKKGETASKAAGKTAVAKKTPKTASERSHATGNSYFAVKTNLAFQAVAIQNIAVDFKLNNHLSLELPLMWSFWDMEREHGVRTFTFQPELRWWLKEPGQGHFFGLHTHVSWFNVKWDENRYQDTGRPLLGGGLSYGYLLPLTSNWGAEFTIGAGYANTRYNTYYNIENGAKINTRDLSYWGVTRVGISLVYRF